MKLTYARTTHPNETVSYTVNGIKGSLFVTFQLHQALMAAAVDGVITVSLSGAPVVETKKAPVVDAADYAAFAAWKAKQAADLKAALDNNTATVTTLQAPRLITLASK